MEQFSKELPNTSGAAVRGCKACDGTGWVPRDPDICSNIKCPECSGAAVRGEPVAESDSTTIKCPACNGHGLIGGHSGQTPESYEEHSEGCEECDGQGKIIISKSDLAASVSPRAADALDSQPTDAAQQGSIGENSRFSQMMRVRVGLDPQGETFKHIVKFIDSRASSAPVAPIAPDGWKPIETAPRTGRTLLLGHFNELGHWRTMRGHWVTKAEIDDEWEESDGFDAGWYETAEEADYPNNWSIYPTHWAVIPPAPQQEGSEAGNG